MLQNNQIYIKNTENMLKVKILSIKNVKKSIKTIFLHLFYIFILKLFLNILQQHQSYILFYKKL